MKGEAHVRAVSNACGLTNDYTRFICKSLARAGYLKFADANVCHLLKKGRSRFDISPAASEPVVVAASANVILFSDKQPQTARFDNDCDEMGDEISSQHAVGDLHIGGDEERARLDAVDDQSAEHHSSDGVAGNAKGHHRDQRAADVGVVRSLGGDDAVRNAGAELLRML